MLLANLGTYAAFCYRFEVSEMEGHKECLLNRAGFIRLYVTVSQALELFRTKSWLAYSVGYSI